MKPRYALITGGTRGIGLGIARALAREGWNLALNGVRPAEAVGEIIDELRAGANTVIYCPGSVRDQAGRAAIVAATRAAFPRLHLLVNNAGIAPRVRADLLEMGEESWDEVLGTNLKGPFFLTQTVARWMIEAKTAAPGEFYAVVNISSISATVVSINRGEYCVAKAGLSMATQLFATRLGSHDIPVYEIRPGVTRTDMTAGVGEKYDRLLGEGLAIQRRWGEPADVGRAVAALARGDFSYSTGLVVMADGGLTVPRL